MQQKGIVQKAAKFLERNMDASCVGIGKEFQKQTLLEKYKSDKTGIYLAEHVATFSSEVTCMGIFPTFSFYRHEAGKRSTSC